MEAAVKRLWLALIPLLLLAGCTAKPALVPATPEEAGLVWRECAATALESSQAEACLGPRPAFGDVDKARWATRTGSGLHLAIGADTYETRHLGLGVIPAWPWDPYILLKNGRPLRALLGEFAAYDPDLSLQRIAGKAAWEFADPRQATIIYDGQDLRALYGLEGAYAPYELGGELAFIGKREGRYALIYGGQQVGPAFDRMPIAYCCEAMLYSPRGAEGRYRFWGWRGDTLYAVEVAPAPLPQALKGMESCGVAFGRPGQDAMDRLKALCRALGVERQGV